LLNKVHREVSKLNGYDGSGCSAADVTRRIYEAMMSTDPVHEMAVVVRWATDVYIDFLYLDPELVTEKARWGLESMDDLKNRLSAHWREVSGTIQRNNLNDEYSTRIVSMRKILCLFLRRLYNHHTQIPDSRAGLEELLLVGEDIDFVERDIHNNAGIHHLFTKLTQDGLPMIQGVQAIGQMIRQYLKEYDQRSWDRCLSTTGQHGSMELASVRSPTSSELMSPNHWHLHKLNHLHSLHPETWSRHGSTTLPCE
jgi:hypothetical protein